MKTSLACATLIALVLLVFTSCKKEIDDTTISNTEDLSATLAAPANALKTIEVRDTGKLKDIYEFYYRRGLLDSISHKNVLSKFSELDYTKVYYPKGSTLPSGYKYLRKNLYGISAAFLIDRNLILKKEISSIPVLYPKDSNSHFTYTYNSNNKLSGSYYINKSEYFEQVYNIGFKKNNILFGSLYADYNYYLSVKRYDSLTNPLNLQNGILFYLSFNPFNYFSVWHMHYAYTGYNPLDLLMLSKNNPGVAYFDFDNRGYYGFINTFKYTYNANNLPVTIKLHKVEGSFPPYGAGRPRYNPETETLTLTYY